MADAQAPELDDDIPQLQPGYDPETGEISEEGEFPPAIRETLAASEAKTWRERPLSPDEINALRAANTPISLGNHGFWPKIPAVREKDGKVKTPGSRIVGQIVGTQTIRSRFGDGFQQIVTVTGKINVPKYRDKKGALVNAVEKLGRFQVGIDATLIELPSHVGDVIDVEFLQTGGSGKRHLYVRVDCWPNEPVTRKEAPPSKPTNGKK